MTESVQVDEFVKLVAKQLCSAIGDLQSEPELATHVGAIDHRRGNHPIDRNGDPCINIEFDLLITAATNKQGETGLSVMGFKAGGGIEKDAASANRIKFSLPMSIPQAKAKAKS